MKGYIAGPRYHIHIRSSFGAVFLGIVRIYPSAFYVPGDLLGRRRPITVMSAPLSMFSLCQVARRTELDITGMRATRGRMSVRRAVLIGHLVGMSMP